MLRCCRFPQSIDAVVKVENALGVWNGLETEVVGFLFKVGFGCWCEGLG